MSYDTMGQLATAIFVLIGALFSFRNGRAIKENTVITKETRDIANGSYTALLKENALMARELAVLKPDSEHIARAVMAEKIFENRLRLTQPGSCRTVSCNERL